MASFQDFVPLFREDVNSIRARIEADVNAGVDPSDDAYQDTTEGHWWSDIVACCVLEIDRLYDVAGTEVPAAALPAFAWGEYLDEHGVTVDLPRKDAVNATGTVTFTGTNGTAIPTGTQVSAPPTDPDADALVYESTTPGMISGGSVDVEVEALEPGFAGNSPGGSVTFLESGISGVASVTNALAMSGGADVETDDRYRERILLEYSAARGGGTEDDYQAWALAFPPIGKVTVQTDWAGDGTVRLVVSDQSGNPVSGSVVTALHDLLDPVPGEGRGLAPVGATVTVATTTLVTVNVSATVTLTPGYLMSEVESELVAAIQEYIDLLNPGEDVVLEHVRARLFTSPSMFDVPIIRLNGVAANAVVGPLEVAQLGTVTFS